MNIGDNVSNYTYDSLGRIASETNNGTSKSYTYNTNGLLFTAGTDTYGYDSYGRLVTFNGVSNFSYDSLGNPTSYKGNTFAWEQGRKLESGTLNSNTFSYAYDMNGLRYKKTVNGNVTEYYLNGSTILAENRKVGTTDNLIYYIYDMMGVSGMIYNGQTYYYEKNTLGDIVGIRNSAGTQVASYTYDAWGNIYIWEDMRYETYKSLSY